MERFEEKIIDLVDVVAGPELDRGFEKTSLMGLSLEGQHPADIKHPETESFFQKEVEKVSTPISREEVKTIHPTDPKELETLVRSEVDRLLRATIDENLPKMIREILTQEVEKAIAREIESLKKT
ncbi:MAG: DUF2497 domain-containing protein [Pseudomonadota bacterium]